MKQRSGNAESEFQFLLARLDQIRMSEHERMRARARLAQAEALAELVVQAMTGAKQLLHGLVIDPIRRLTTSLG